MADYDQDIGIGDDVARVGDPNLRFRLIVVRDQDEIIAQSFEGVDRLLDRQLRAELDTIADRRLLAGKRRLHGDLDRALLRPRWGGEV